MGTLNTQQLQRPTLPTSNPTAVARPSQNHRFHLLDALRGILAILVVYRHSPAYLTNLVQTKDIFLAVDFFFCLSGFVIAYAYEEKLQTRLCTRDFMVARLIRFYPTFLVGMALAFTVALGSAHLLTRAGGKQIAEAALPSLLFLPSIPLAAAGLLLFPLNMSAWTLLLELFANLGFGLLVRGKRFVTGALVLVCLASFAILVFAPQQLDSGSTWPGALVGLARMGLSFSLGVFVLRYWKAAPVGRLRRTGGLCTASTVVLLLLASILLPTPVSGTRAYQITIMALVMPALIFFGADIRLGKFGSKVCSILGDLSYPLYIIHLPLMSPLFGSRVAHLAVGSKSLMQFLVPIYILLLASFAWALRVYFDAPLGGWLMRRYKAYRDASAARRQALAAIRANWETAQEFSSISGGTDYEQRYAPYPQRS